MSTDASVSIESQSGSALRRTLALPAYLLIVAAQLGVTGLIALTSFLSVAASDSSFSAWVVGSAVTVGAGALTFLSARWLWRALGRSTALVISTWTVALGTIVVSQLTFAVARELVRVSQGARAPSDLAHLSSERAPTEVLAASEDRFTECFRVLSQRDAMDAAQAAARRVHREDVEEIAYRTLLAVCERHASRPIDSLVPYFVRSAENLAKKAREIWWTAERCELVEPSCGFDLEQHMLRQQRLELVHEAMCRLEPRKRQALEGRLEGIPYAELAARLATSEENARQLASRALAEVRAKLRARCNQ